MIHIVDLNVLGNPDLSSCLRIYYTVRSFQDPPLFGSWEEYLLDKLHENNFEIKIILKIKDH